MRKPNSELFRLLRFAIKYPGWHTYAPSMARHIKRAESLGLLEVSVENKQFKLPAPTYHGVY